ILPAVLRRSAALGLGGKKATDMAELTIPGSKGNLFIADRSFRVENVGGKIVATGENHGQSFISWLAPSTITTRLSTRVMAQKAVLAKGGTTVGADDLYQAAVRLEQASVPLKLALVTGFGEAGEEIAQA